MLSELEQTCKTFSTESFNELIKFDGSWQHIFVTTQTILVHQGIQMCSLGLTIGHTLSYGSLNISGSNDIYQTLSPKCLLIRSY